MVNIGDEEDKKYEIPKDSLSGSEGHKEEDK